MAPLFGAWPHCLEPLDLPHWTAMIATCPSPLRDTRTGEIPALHDAQPRIRPDPEIESALCRTSRDRTQVLRIAG